MKTYEIIIKGESKFFKTDAESSTIQQAIDFVKNGEVTLDRVLVAIRMLGGKATPIALEPVDIFMV